MFRMSQTLLCIHILLYKHLFAADDNYTCACGHTTLNRARLDFYSLDCPATGAAGCVLLGWLILASIHSEMIFARSLGVCSVSLCISWYMP